MRTLVFPTNPPPGHCDHPNLPLLSLTKVRTASTLRHFASPRASGGMSPLHFAKCTHIVLHLML